MGSQFPPTQWSLIQRAAQEGPVGSREQMGELLQQYRRPMHVHLRFKGMSEDRAEDLLQDFMIEVLNGDLLALADPQKGKFRNLLLTALDRFRISKHRYEIAAKRSPGQLASLDALEVDATHAPDATAALAFERAWALDVIAEALARMEQECEQAADGARWDIFHHRIVAPLLADEAPLEYADLAARHGLPNEKGAMNVLVTAKRQFARILREVIAEYITRGAGRGDSAAATPEAADRLARHLDEHQLQQAVEREVRDLHAVLLRSRAVSDIAWEFRETPTAFAGAEAKSRYWLLLAQRGSAAQTDLVSLFDTAGDDSDDALQIAFAEIIQQDLRRFPGFESAAGTTVQQCLTSESPDLALLIRLKDWVNLQRASRSKGVPATLANGLYFLILATALVRTGERITSLATEQFRHGLEWLCEQSWASPEHRQIARAALERLQTR